MNEEVINDLYNNAVSKGYKKSREEFVSLLQSNDAVVNDMYSYAKSKGYKKGVDDFKGLIGVTSPVVEKPLVEQPKKKEVTVSPFVAGGSELTKFDPRTGQVVQETPSFTKPSDVKPKAPQQPTPEFKPLDGPFKPGEGIKYTEQDFDSKVQKQKVSAPMSYSNIFAKTIADLPSDLAETWSIASAFVERQLGKAGVPGADPNLTAKDIYFYNVSDDWRKYTDEVFPTNKEDRSTFLGGVVSGLGQVVPMVVSGGISTVSKGKAAMDIAKTALSTGTKLTPFIKMGKDIGKQAASPTGLIGGSQMSSALYKEAIDLGATEDQAQKYAIENFFVGTVAESLPIQSMFSRILKAEPTANILRILKEGSIGAGQEAVTEMWQTTYENWSAQRIYDFNREMLDGVGEAGAIGGTVGFILNTALSALVGRRAKVKTKEEEEILDKSIDEVKSKINTVNRNNENISSVAEELDSIEPIVLNYGDSKYFFARDKSGRMELAEDPMLEDQAKSMSNMLGKVYKGLEFSIEEVRSNDPYAPVKYNVIANEKTKQQEDAIQEQAAGQVPVQSETGISQEMAQGEPQAEPQGITKENIQEKIAENNNKAEELRNRQKAELEELNKRENKNYADAFDILNVNEYSQDQTPRSQDAIDLANRHEKEFNDLLQEKRNIESEAEKLNFSDYNLTDTNKLDRLRESINSVYQSNRNALDEGFEVSVNALDEANAVGASDYVAHGMGKTSLANAYNDLVNLFSKGINPIRGRGSLDVAPLSGGVSTGTTASGNAYMDGPFTLVANRNHSGPITNINQVGGIIVNEGLATPEVLTSLRELFPNLVIESTSNTKSLVEQLNTKPQAELQTQEGQVQEEVIPAQEQIAEEDIALSGLRDGFQSVTRNSFDVRSDADVMQKIGEKKSFATSVTRKGKKYLVVGLRLNQDTGETTSGRDGYSFATIEDNGNLPSNAVDILTQKAVSNASSIYPNIKEPTIDMFVPLEGKQEVIPASIQPEVDKINEAQQAQEEVTTAPARKETFEELMEKSRIEGEAIEAETKDFNSKNEREFSGRKDKGIIQNDIIQAEDDVFSAQRRIGSADDVESAINEYNKAKQKVSELEEEINQLDNFNDVNNLISQEIESSKKPDYEYRELFKKDPRLASIQNHRDLIDFLKTIEGKEDSISRYERFIKILEEDIKKYPIKEQVAKAKKATKQAVSKKKNREDIISRPAFTPTTLARQWLLSGGKLRSIQSEENKIRGVGVGKGVREETGMGGVEMRQLVGVIDNKRGLSPEVAAERIYENLNEELQASMDVQDIRDAIIEVVSSEDRKTWIENQDRETSESEDFDEYDQWVYSQLTDQERADFDEYQQTQSYYDYLDQNAKRLAKEYDAYIKSKTYQDYIEEIYGRERKGKDNAKDQNDGRGKKQGTDEGKIAVQEKEQVEGDINELLKLNPKEKSTGQKALDYLDNLLKDYDNIEKEGLGVNIALPVIKKIIQGVRALVKAGMSLSDAINKVAKDNDVSVEDVINSIDEIGKQKKKAAPSVAKILGKPRKKITVDEMAALKDQIKLEARAARQAKGDLNKKRGALAARIIAARRNGAITAAQARTLVNRINRVNLDNPIMVDRLIQYTDKVFDNANYAADMVELRKLQKQAKSKKHTSMKDFVDRFTSINPELIPLDRIQDYKEALDFLNNRTPSYARMNNMLTEIESYQVSEEFDAAKTFDALMNKYESIALNQVGNVEEYVDLIKDINSFKRKAFQLLQNEAIEQEEYDNLIEMVGKDQAEIEKRYEKQISQIKKGLIAEIKNQRPKTNPEFTKEENDLIKEYLELSDADLQSLSPENLFVLNDLLENISNGEIDYYRLKDVVSKAANNKAGIEVGKQLKASNLSLGSAELRKKMAQFESSFWEGLLGLGRATSGPLQKFIISPFNRAIGSYEKFLRDGYNDFLKLKKEYKIDEKGMNKIGMLTTYLQEYMAQFDPKNKGVKDIGNRDWFKQILDSETMRDDYSPEELKTIEEIHKSLPKDSDGNVSPEAVYNSYMANDGRFFTKNEKGFFDSIMDWKKQNSTSKQKAANEMSGNAFKEIPFHMLRSRYAGQTAQITPTASGDNGMVRIKAGTGKERASEAVGAINTNFEKLFIKGLEQTGRDYFLSKTLKDINNVLASAKKELDGDKDPLVKAISYTLSDALSYEFSDTASQNLLKRLVQARAAMTLFDPIRAGVEFTSTLLSFGLRARTLSGYKNLFGSQGDMKNLLEFTDSPLRLRQNINNAIDINDGRIEPQGMLMKWTTFLSGLPERTMMVTSWMPTFTNEFKRITGEKFDMKKFNDSEAYREKYGKAIKESSAVADAQTEKIIGPTTKAGQRREIIIFPGKTVGRDTVSGQILGFFSNYPYREVTEFVNGFREAGEVLKKGDSVEAISQLQKPLGIALNVAAYGFLSSVVYASRLILLGDDEEEKRGTKLLEELMTAKGFIEETAANAAALAASKYAGGGRAILQLLGTLGIALTDNEETKSTIKKMLKGSVYVDPLPTQKLSGYGTADKVNTAILKYIPQFVVLSNIIIDGIGGLNEVKAIYEKIEKKGVDALTKDEELRVLALSVMFTATQLLLNYRGTSLPSYNNLKAGMKAVKEEAGVADIAAGKVPTKKKTSGGGGGGSKTMTKSDLKKYFPDQYNELYGEGSATYEIEQEIKAFEKEQRELKKSIKDQVYGGQD